MGTREGKIGCCVWLALYAPKTAAIKLYTPLGDDMVSGMAYEPDEQG